MAQNRSATADRTRVNLAWKTIEGRLQDAEARCATLGAALERLIAVSQRARQVIRRSHPVNDGLFRAELQGLEALRIQREGVA